MSEKEDPEGRKITQCSAVCRQGQERLQACTKERSQPGLMAELGRLSGKKKKKTFLRFSKFQHHLVSQGQALFCRPCLSLPKLKSAQLLL